MKTQSVSRLISPMHQFNLFWQKPMHKFLKVIEPLWLFLSPRRRRQLLIQQGLSLASSVAEVSNLATLIFFLDVLANPTVGTQKVITYFPFLAGLDTGTLILGLGAAFVIAAILSAVLRILVTLGQYKLGALIASDLSALVFENVLFRPYAWHLNQNSSFILGLMFEDIDRVSLVIIGILGLFSNVLIVITLGFSLLTISPVIMLMISVIMLLSYWIIFQLTRATLYQDGLSRTQSYRGSMQLAQEGIGGVRDVIIDRSQDIFLGTFTSLYRQFRLDTFRINFKAATPRYVIESLSMILIIGISLVLFFQGKGIESQLPVLGSIALGAYRILQPLQTCFSSLTTIKSCQPSINKVLPFTRQNISREKQLAMSEQAKLNNHTIELQDVSFRYHDDQAWVLQDLSLTIPQGSRVAFVGTTGSGKSTTIDLILGLLQPTQGQILVGGQDLANAQVTQAWQSQLAHVPQFIYLRDASFAENIAFGVPLDLIDHNRVQWAASQAQIADLINTQPKGYQTLIGERGVKLSGGQRQRLGIARALYKQAKVLVFDEATSALDNETEAKVMRAITETTQDVTLIMIAHRLSTVENCDIIFMLQHGKLIAQGSYAELLQTSPNFAKLANAESEPANNI